MKKIFVPTANTDRFYGALSVLEQRGAEEACLIVVDGLPGLGKTETVQHFAAQTGSIYLRAKVGWKANWFLSDLLEELQIQPEHGVQKRFKQAVAALSMAMEKAEIEDRQFALIVDEIDHISRNLKVLETIRDLSDLLEIPTILVGMGKIRDRLKAYPQIASRVAQKVEFAPASIEDIRLLADGLCDVRIADDLSAFLHAQSKGFAREIKEGLASIERFGRRNQMKEVTLEAMSGQMLMHDRASGAAVKVREREVA